jgi:Fe-S-cluster containining protein
MINILKILKPIYYEFMSNFVLEKIKYDIEGECCKCGDCCRFMYSLDTYTEKEFMLMTKFYPKYKRFKVIGKDEHGNLILACKLIDETGLCPDYENRLEMCKDYPNLKRIKAGGRLYERCTYRLKPQNSFESYIKKESI